MINEQGILEAPYNLATLSQATGNPMLDLGYQCCDMRPYFEYKKDNVFYYTTVHPKNLTLSVINVYEKYVKNVDGIEYDAMKYVGNTTATSGTTITFNNVVYTYTENIVNIREFYINKWAKYKPVRVPDPAINAGYIIIDTISDEIRGNGNINWGFDMNKTGSDALGSTTLNKILTDAQTYNGQWVYQPPIPGQLDYFRMTDFDGYNPNATPPFKYVYEKNGYTYAANVSDISFVFNIYKEDSELNLSDFGFIQQDNAYKFALIYGKNLADVHYSISNINVISNPTDVSTGRIATLSANISGITDGDNLFIGCIAAVKGTPTDDGNNLVDGGFFLPNGYLTFNYSKLRIPIDLYIEPGNVSDSDFNFIVEYSYLNGDASSTRVPVLKFANNGNMIKYRARAQIGSSLNPPTTQLAVAKGNITLYIWGYNADGDSIKDGELPLFFDETDNPNDSLNIYYENKNTVEDPSNIENTTEIIDPSTSSSFYNLLRFFTEEEWNKVKSLKVQFMVVNDGANTNGSWILHNDKEYLVTIINN